MTHSWEHLIKARKTIIEMLSDRGYNMDNYKSSITEKEIKKMYDKDYIQIIGSNKNGNIRCCSFIWDEILDVADITDYMDNIKQDINKWIIILIEDKKSSRKKRLDNTLRRDKIEYQILYLQDLYFNVTKHFLVPKHILLTEDESDIIKSDYDKHNLPKIQKYDPICTYYDGKIGNIFKILRPNHIYYRVVVDHD